MVANVRDVMSVACAQVTKIMLKRGYNVNETDDVGRIALYEAVAYMHLENVKLLIEHGANVNVLSNDGEASVFYFAADYEDKNRMLEILKTLMDVGAKMFVPDENHGGMMQVSGILSAGDKDDSIKDGDGMTALHDLSSITNPGVFEL